VPIFKAGDPTLCDNYRPIALLSSLSKTLEKIVANRLTNHLVNHKLLFEGQFGFQRNRNTEQNLVRIVNYISSKMNNGEYCLGVFLDLKKAFDVCSHEILLKKLNNLGIRGVAARWFENYLSDRKQLVELGSSKSSTKALTISIIQGSILGPILFNIFINDLPRATTLHMTMFADDTQALGSHKNLNTLVDHVNTELHTLATWFRANKMAVNTSKTQYIIFHTKGKHIIEPESGVVFNNNEEGENLPNLITKLERIHENHPSPGMRHYKLLGILLDEHLTFTRNTTALIGKLNKAAHFMNKVKHLLPQKALTSLYYALGHSHLTYCPIIASSTNKTNIEKIYKAQKKLIRITCNKPFKSHTQPLFEQLSILQYRNIITQARLHFMHAITYDHAPPSFNNTWIKNEQRDINYTLRNAGDFQVPRINYEFFRNSPLVTLPETWNTADPVKFHRNWFTFRTSLKEILLNNQSAHKAEQISAQHQHLHQHEHEHQGGDGHPAPPSQAPI
jgi:hypothetical protein